MAENMNEAEQERSRKNGSGRKTGAAAAASIAKIRNEIRFGSIGHAMRNNENTERRRKKKHGIVYTRNFAIFKCYGALCTVRTLHTI